jgi:hypothetical protein
VILRAKLPFLDAFTSNYRCLMLVMGTGTILRSVHWARTLPILAFAITAALVIVSAKQDQEFWAAHAHFSDTPWEFQAPARLFAQLLNGPSFYLTAWAGDFGAFGLYFPDAGRLLGVVLFWFWVGWALDRRLRRTRTAFVRSRLLRGTLCAAMLALTCLFGSVIVGNLHPHELWRYMVSIKLHSSTWRAFALRRSAWAAYAMLPWTVAFGSYFARKLLVTAMSPNLAETGAASVKQI